MRKDIFEESWLYRVMVILCLCILLVYTYLTNEETLLNYVGGKFILDSRLMWQIGIFAMLSLVLFYLLESTLDYKSQNEVLKEYVRKVQGEIDSERQAIEDLKSVSGDKIIKLGSFVITISDMAKEFNSVLETTLLLQTMLIKTSELLGSKKCAIFSIDSKKTLHLVDAFGYNKDELTGFSLTADNEESGMAGLAALDGKFYSKAILEADYTKKHVLKNDKFQLQFCQPIIYRGEVLAVICIGEVKEGLLDDYIVRILSTIANFGAVALSNSRLVERIKDQSIRDGLTGLYNHQYFQERLDELLSLAIKEKQPLGFIMIDLDHFKKLNDTYGHQMGDIGLKKLAHILKSRTRKDDIIARYGGEEFVCILFGMSIEKTAELAEKIRADFKNTVLEFDDAKTTCTLSAGVAAYMPEKTYDMKKNKLIRIADKALYEAKEKGRDKVVIDKSLPAGRQGV
ncbi:MAG: GGDEF domain-containing protein [Candidatus Omnitrophica bacterium]|nr:GGDEF domain-containing protein [Candidatus Omnitrophota bacterium]